MITKHGPALATFISDSRGATALLFAIVAVPVLLGAAFVIDYSRATNTRAALDAAADAAALAAAKVAGEKVQGAIFADKDKDKALADAKAIGEATFRSIAAQKVSPVGDPSVQVKLVKGGVSATVSYEHANQNAFAGVFDKTAIDLRGSATASFSFAPYIDIYVLLDTSNSMGLGATLAAQQQMQQKIGCIFGCHVAGSNAYQATKNLGIPMRVDVLRGALEKMLETAVSATAGLKGNQLRVGVYTFSNKFEKLAPLTASL
jgi:Flp pilus assembly protein TadG